VSGERGVCFSDADDGSTCYSHFYSTNSGSSNDDYTFASVSDLVVFIIIE
jgi:hypothetical protein